MVTRISSNDFGGSITDGNPCDKAGSIADDTPDNEALSITDGTPDDLGVSNGSKKQVKILNKEANI